MAPKITRNADGTVTVTAEDGTSRTFTMKPASKAQQARNRESMDAVHKFWNDAASAEAEQEDEDE